MRTAAILLSAALILPASLPAQTTCSDFVSFSDDNQIYYVAGLATGYVTAASAAETAVETLGPARADSSGSAVYAVALAQNPDADPDSLRRAVNEKQDARADGAEIVAAFLNRQLADTTATNEIIKLRMEAACSRHRNADSPTGTIFWQVLRDLEQAQRR